MSQPSTSDCSPARTTHLCPARLRPHNPSSLPPSGLKIRLVFGPQARGTWSAVPWGHLGLPLQLWLGGTACGGTESCWMPSPAPVERVRSEGLARQPVCPLRACNPSQHTRPWLSSACPLCDEWVFSDDGLNKQHWTKPPPCVVLSLRRGCRGGDCGAPPKHWQQRTAHTGCDGDPESVLRGKGGGPGRHLHLAAPVVQVHPPRPQLPSQPPPCPERDLPVSGVAPSRPGLAHW